MAVVSNRRSVMTLFSRPTDIHSHRARLVLADLVDPGRRLRHDTERLASTVMRLYFERDLRMQVNSEATEEAAAPRG